MMRLGSTTVLLYVFVVITQIATGIYLASGIETPALFQLLYPVCFLWIIGWWLWDDSKKRQIPWIYDLGFFLYLAWPFILLYHLVNSRGVKGLLVIAGFVAVYYVALLAGLTLYFLLAPPEWPSIFQDP
jgi:hypothetical protein